MPFHMLRNPWRHVINTYLFILFLTSSLQNIHNCSQHMSQTNAVNVMMA